MAPFSTTFPPSSSSGRFPLCLSGITNPIAFSKEVADHDRRRKVLKKMKHQISGECFWPLDQLTGAEIRQDHEINMVSSDDYNSEEAAGDLDGVVGDLSSLSLTSSSCTAKAA